MTGTSPEFCVVTLGDRFRLDSFPPAVRELVSREGLELFSQFPGAQDDFPAMCCLTDGDEEICHMRAIPDTITVDDVTYRWAWGGDNFTRPQFRGQGYSTRLQSQATAYLHERDIGRGSVSSTPVTLHIFRKLGFSVLGYVPRYVMLRTAKPLVDAYCKRPMFTRTCNALLQPVNISMSWLLKQWNATLLGRTVCSSVSSESEEKWRNLLAMLFHGRNVSFSMNPDHLVTKCEMAARRAQISRWLIESDNGDPIGYLIVRERIQNEPLRGLQGFRLMTLLDVGCPDDNAAAAAAVTGHAIQRFFKSGAEVLEIVSSNPLIQKAARRRGMISVGKGMSFMVHVPQSWPWPARLKELSNWPLTNFCGDAFSF